MGTFVLPPINHLVDVVLSDGEAYQSRVEDIERDVLVVGAPFGISSADLPRIGSTLELTWVAEDRRQAVDARLRGLTKEQPPRWELAAVSPVRLQTRRHYVRGGGGEGIEVTRGGETFAGRIVNLSEGGIRCRVLSPSFGRDDRVEVHLALGDDALTLAGTVLFVRHDPEAAAYDLVITYESSESAGRTIRGYVMRREMEERRRMKAAS